MFIAPEFALASKMKMQDAFFWLNLFLRCYGEMSPRVRCALLVIMTTNTIA
jgi:hypothetical protein